MRNLDIKTKHFDQQTFQTPQFENSWGSMIEVLDYVLVNGSNTQEIVSISIADDNKFPELYWIATLTLNLGHGFKENLSVVEIKGCIIPEYNQVFRVQTATPTSIDIAFSKTKYPNRPKDVPGTLGCTIRLPALGYQKAFEEAQKAAYKVTLADNKFCFLRVDNSCPDGWTPSWTKISRVSMLSEMQHINDYKYIRGRKKAPALIDNYDFSEENFYSAWVGNQSNGRSGFDIKTTTGLVIKDFLFLGDSDSFLFYIPNHRYHSDLIVEDSCYVFGKYNKYIYKEDPKPFMLKASERSSLESFTLDSSGSYNNITRDRATGKYTFSTKDEGLLEVDVSDNFALHLADTQLSGSDTRINFKPYKNEINILLTPFDLRFFRTSNTVLEGKYRGIFSIIGNIKDNAHLAPQNFEVFENSGKHFIWLPSKHELGQGPTSCIAVLLNDWE